MQEIFMTAFYHPLHDEFVVVSAIGVQEKHLKASGKVLQFFPYLTWGSKPKVPD